MLLNSILRPSVDKYSILSINRRGKLHAVIDCLYLFCESQLWIGSKRKVETLASPMASNACPQPYHPKEVSGDHGQLFRPCLALSAWHSRYMSRRVFANPSWRQLRITNVVTVVGSTTAVLPRQAYGEVDLVISNPWTLLLLLFSTTNVCSIVFPSLLYTWPWMKVSINGILQEIAVLLPLPSNLLLIISRRVPSISPIISS